MLHNLLLLLEATPSGTVAKTVACRIAIQGNWNMTGLEIRETDWRIDPGDMNTLHRASVLERMQDARHRLSSNETSENVMSGTGCIPNSSVTYNEKVLCGPKYSLLSGEAEVNDLTVIGREGNFGDHWSDTVKEIINLMLEYRPRPVIIAPPEFKDGRDVLIAYDGSPAASRAVQLFVLLGLADEKNIHVLSVNRKKEVAVTRVEAITTYLKNHNIEVTQYAIDSRAEPVEVIVDKINEINPTMVVAGGFSAASWQRSLFGSVSEYLIRYCTSPLFACP